MGGNMRLRNKKTGKIYTLSENLYIEYTQGGKIEVRAIIPGGNMSYYYDSLDKLNEDWEDVKEPLIKDKKVRKVVRAWAEANDLDGATFHTSSHFFHYWNLRGFNDNGMGVDIDFFLTGEGIPNLIDGKYYTKFELCGEEEE